VYRVYENKWGLFRCEDSHNIPLDEEINVDATKFFELIKYSGEPLWDRCIIHKKLSNIAQVFTTKIDYRLSKRDYDWIIKLVKNVLPEGNSLKYNFFVVKFMMKPLVIGTKKLIYVQTFACWTMMNMQISLSAKLVSMLDINTIVIEKGHLSHTKKSWYFSITTKL
jgi:hypothetical protein